MTTRALLACLLVAWSAVAAMGCAPEPNHVVVVSIDTLRFDHTTVYGHVRDTTPNLARLARVGVVFENAFAASTNTAPSHASMFTGTYPARNGVLHNGYPLLPGVATLAEVLGGGYASAAFVSGFPLQREMARLDRGFEHYDDDLASDWQRSAETTFARAREWLLEREHDTRPVFLFLHLYDPHHPYDAPKAFATRFLPADQHAFQFPLEPAYRRFFEGKARPEEFAEYILRYDGEIAYADDTLGRLFTTLKELGYWERALVVVLSDHGESLDERAVPFDHGWSLYEEQLRIPWVLRLPGDRFAGRRVAEAVHHVDLAPTILDFLDRPPLPDAHGRSLLTLLDSGGHATGERPVFSTARPEAWRVPELGTALDEAGVVAAVRAYPWKLISYPAGVAGEVFQLFQLETDPGEARNLAAARPGKRAELARTLEDWRRDVGGDAIDAPRISPEQEEGLRALGYIE